MTHDNNALAQELEACPFCGNDGSGPIEDALHVSFQEHDWREPSWTPQCDKCTGTMGYFNSEEEAIAAWNTRTQPAPASGEVGELVEALRTTRGDLFDARSLCNEAADMLERLAGAGESSPDESLGWERGMRDAANICGSLAETTYDDADAFEAATGCEAAIQSDLKAHQRNRLAAQPTQQPGDQVERARQEAITLIDELNERATSRKFYGIDQTLHAKLCTIRATLARAAIAAMQSPPAQGEG